MYVMPSLSMESMLRRMLMMLADWRRVIEFLTPSSISNSLLASAKNLYPKL